MSDILIRWLEAEKNISELKEQKQAIETKIKEYERDLEGARAEYVSYMQDNGLVEDEVIGEFVKYKISFSKPRGSVNVIDANAVPDEFCEIVRKPILTEIRKFIEENTVNWATIEYGTPQLTYKIMKK